jgi:2-polyprenyl-3-methyl-5-hydroxy-6-metoxy-1,4-benzoquinol methylase|tara:strand:+ start:2365 stop:3381 length:1017 start_codon:yes stop_codon:yes gene_type:complete
MELEYVDCDYCKDSKSKPIYSEGVLGLSQCIRCGFVFTNPRFPQTELSRLYDEKFKIGVVEARDRLKKITGKEKEYSKCMKQEEDIVNRMIEKDFKLVLKYKRKGKLLDVGCDNGARLQVAYDHGWRDLHGLELSDAVVNTLHNRFNLPDSKKRFQNSHLMEASFESESFDVITLWSVLEHMTFPFENLHEVARLLKKRGVVILRVPNVRHELGRKYVRNLSLFVLPKWLRRILGISDNYRPRLNELFDLTKIPISEKGSLDLEYHINHFSDKTLCKFLEKAGLSVVESRYGDMFVFQEAIKDKLEQWFVGFLRFFYLISGNKLPNLSSQLLIVARKM